MKAVATVNIDGTGTVAIDGESTEHVSTTSVAEARRRILGIVRAHAKACGQSVTVKAQEVDTEYRLRVAPDGSVEEVPEPPEAAMPPSKGAARRDDKPRPKRTPRAKPTPKAVSTMTTTNAQATEVESPREAAPRARHSFLDESKPAHVADSGWRGFLVGLGLKVAPGPAELSRKQDERAVARQWAGPRTIAVVNGKGGAGKTPTTVLLSALFARHGGSGVLAWDNNEARGTLGWRTEQGPHTAHLLDLLPSTESLMAPTARASDLDTYVHHQTADQYEVLRSNPEMLAVEQRLTADDFKAVHAVAAKYWRIIIVDSGNDESAPNWREMIEKADQVVVATTTRPDHAEAGILLLDALRAQGAHGQHLADNAVVVVAQADREEASAQRIASGFDGAARTAVTVPYDKALRAGQLKLDNLRPATRRAYLRAAAAVSDGL